MESYQSWFGEGPELSVLRMLGLFDRPADEKAMAALVQVFNAGTGEEFHQLLTAKSQKVLLLPQATAALTHLCNKFGKITGALTLAKTEGDLRFYRGKGERGAFVVPLLNVPDWERQMTAWLNATLNHSGPIGDGIRPRASAG